jgi:class 3 adenylate cyclase
MVDSSALSTRLNPEEQREVVSSFQGCRATGIKRLGGMVAQHLGDGVLAHFGYPTAHEDDAERAVRAGLAVLNAVPILKQAHGVTVQARIGFATGVVVVGDLVREGFRTPARRARACAISSRLQQQLS